MDRCDCMLRTHSKWSWTQNSNQSTPNRSQHTSVYWDHLQTVRELVNEFKCTATSVFDLWTPAFLRSHVILQFGGTTNPLLLDTCNNRCNLIGHIYVGDCPTSETHVKVFFYGFTMDIPSQCTYMYPFNNNLVPRPLSFFQRCTRKEGGLGIKIMCVTLSVERL